MINKITHNLYISHNKLTNNFEIAFLRHKTNSQYIKQKTLTHTLNNINLDSTNYPDIST